MFVGLDRAQNTNGFQMHMNNYNQSKHLDQHIGQNNVHGHGSFNLKQSSIEHSFWNFFEFHNQFALLTMMQ